MINVRVDEVDCAIAQFSSGGWRVPLYGSPDWCLKGVESDQR